MSSLTATTEDRGAIQLRRNETNASGYLTYILYDRSGVRVLPTPPARGAAVVHPAYRIYTSPNCSPLELLVNSCKMHIVEAS